MEKVRHTAVLYLLAQGAAVVVWWALLLIRPESRAYFQLDADSQTSLIAFLLPDAAFLAVGSAVAAYLVHTRNRFETAALWMLSGAVGYAFAYTFSYTLATDRGWLGVVMMFPAMIWTGVFAMALTVKSDMFREAKAASANYVLFKTFAQIVVVWGLILFVFPYLITVVEDKVGVPRLEFAGQRAVAALLFVALSSIGVYAAIVMSRIGKGTPLPLDHASDLVILGPYAYVRNPMAVSGIGQGLAVALFFGSPLVALYALMGSAIWQFVFRPLEEDDLVGRFSDSYADYRGAVKCWVPRSKRYESASHQIDGTADSSNSVERPSGRI